jgi:hypothetical protein
MENMTLKTVVIKRMQDIFSDVKWANHLVEEGKEVPADRKLQGIRTKMLALMEMVHKNLPDELEFIQEEEAPNVAQENNKTE